MAMKIKVREMSELSEAVSPEVKDIATYVKGIQPETDVVSDAYGNSHSVTFPKWYSDTQKLLFPAPCYTEEDMRKILDAGKKYIAGKYGEGTYALAMTRVYSVAFHSGCYAIKIKKA